MGPSPPKYLVIPSHHKFRVTMPWRPPTTSHQPYQYLIRNTAGMENNTDQFSGKIRAISFHDKRNADLSFQWYQMKIIEKQKLIIKWNVNKWTQRNFNLFLGWQYPWNYEYYNFHNPSQYRACQLDLYGQMLVKYQSRYKPSFNLKCALFCSVTGHFVSASMFWCPTHTECYYNRVQYNMLLHTSQQWMMQNTNQEFEPTKDTPYLALTGELWGVFFEDFG